MLAQQYTYCAHIHVQAKLYYHFCAYGTLLKFICKYLFSFLNMGDIVQVTYNVAVLVSGAQHSDLTTLSYTHDNQGSHDTIPLQYY